MLHPFPPGAIDITSLKLPSQKEENKMLAVLAEPDVEKMRYRGDFTLEHRTDPGLARTAPELSLIC